MNYFILHRNRWWISILLFLLTSFLVSACTPLTPPTIPPTTTVPTVIPSIQPTTAVPTASPTSTSGGLKELRITNSIGERIPVKVQVPEPMSDAFLHGLEGITTLPENQGMLFIWQQDETIPFQMWHTSLPLSIAFVSRDMKILQIEDMQPFYEGTYAPLFPYRYALEVNQGFFKRNQIQVGDIVNWAI